MTDRLIALREHLQNMNDAGPRRTKTFELLAESLAKTREEPRQERRAKAFAHLLDHAVQVVLPHETLIGSNSGMWVPTIDFPDYPGMRAEAVRCVERFKAAKQEQGPPAKEKRFALISRDHYDANITYGDLQALIRELQQLYRNDAVITSLDVSRELEEHFVFDYGDRTRTLLADLPWAAGNHLSLDYERLIKVGYGNLGRQLESAAAQHGPEQSEFFRAARIANDAAIRYIRRYADTIRSAASECRDGARATELLIAADRMQRIATEPAVTFPEAMQLLWITHIIANLEGGSALSFARFDQYLGPIYATGLRAGTVTEEEARTLVSCLWLKVNEPKMRTVQSMTLGGVGTDGGDASNSLTRLCLEICAELKQPFPNTALRVHKGSPDDLYDLALESIRQGSGNPMILNDEVWIPAMRRRGYSLPDARNYYNMGCVEMMVPACQPYWVGVDVVSFPALLLDVLKRGRERSAPYASFSEMFDRYLLDIAARVRGAFKGAEEYLQRARDHYYDPFASLLVNDCLERGKDLFQGGSRYPVVFAVDGAGLGTAVDSLAAIRKHVFDDGTMSWSDLSEIVQGDFRGREDVRMMLDAQTPCFGNDLPEVDEMAQQVLRTFTEAVHALNGEGYAGTFVSSLFSYTNQVSRGELTDATPNGRRARQPLSDNAGPSQGKDTRGPTALLNSVTTLDLERITGAFAMNLRVLPDLLRGDHAHRSFKSLLKTYFQNDGLQIQVNCIGRDVLEDAKQHPERHRDLIVRIAGFCEYFNNLDDKLKDEIITRTAYSRA